MQLLAGFQSLTPPLKAAQFLMVPLRFRFPTLLVPVGDPHPTCAPIDQPALWKAAASSGEDGVRPSGRARQQHSVFRTSGSSPVSGARPGSAHPTRDRCGGLLTLPPSAGDTAVHTRDAEDGAPDTPHGGPESQTPSPPCLPKTPPPGPGVLACPLPRLTPLECEYPACLQLCSWLQQLLSKYLPREGTGRRPAEPQPPRKAQDPLGKSKACRYAHHPLLPHPSWKHCSPS